jgi:hypothetical protein
MKWPLTRKENLQVTAIALPLAIIAGVMALAGAGMLALYVVPLGGTVPILMLLERSRRDHEPPPLSRRRR